MQRDNDYIRELLFRYEADPQWCLVMPGQTLGGDTAEWRERYHVHLMMDDGLLAGVGRGTMRITAAGHDFLDAIRDEGVWTKTKQAVAETGGSATFEIVRALAVGYLKTKIEKHTGISLD